MGEAILIQYDQVTNRCFKVRKLKVGMPECQKCFPRRVGVLASLAISYLTKLTKCCMSVYIQILGTCTGDSDPSVLLFFDDARYLFNMGEGTQRFCLEHKVAMKKLRGIFLSELCSESVGGLPGGLLTLADMKLDKVTICGPKYTTNLLHAIRHFAKRPSLSVSVNELDETNSHTGSPYIDDKVKIIPIQLNVLKKKSPPAPPSLAKGIDEVSVARKRPLPGVTDSENDEAMPTSKRRKTPSSSTATGPALAESTETSGFVGTIVSMSSASVGVSEFVEPTGDKKSAISHARSYSFIKVSRNCMRVDAVSGQARFEVLCAEARVGKCDIMNAAPSNLAGDEAVFVEGHGIHKRCSCYRTCSRVDCPFAHDSTWMASEGVIDPPRFTWCFPLTRREVADPHSMQRLLCFMVHTPDIPGTFYPAKAKALGMKPGPLFGRLSKGESVTLEDGRVVTPEDVMGAATPGPVVMVIKLPSLGALQAAVDSHALVSYYYRSDSAKATLDGAVPFSVVTVAVIIAPPMVVESALFGSWSKLFGDSTQFIILNKNSSSQQPVFIKCLTNASRLNALHSRIFPLTPSMIGFTVAEEKGGKAVAATSALQPGYNMMKYVLKPVRQIGFAPDMALPPVDHAALRKSVLAMPNMRKHLETLAACEATRSLSGLTGVETNSDSRRNLSLAKDIEVSFLGTGSSIPSAYRNVSGILVNVAGRGVILDAGEGSYGQIVRLFGWERSQEIINNLECIWISHMHADHHLGLLHILSKRGPLCPPLKVIGPRELATWMSEYTSIITNTASENIHHADDELPLSTPRYIFLDSSDFLVGMDEARVDCLTRSTPTENPLSAIGIRIETVRVEHCYDAYGIVIRSVPLHDAPREISAPVSPAAWSLVYSGDTMPCERLVAAGRGSLVLIHEATLSDDLEADALHKKHSTFSQALDVARRMGVYRCVLTHFSQRYPKKVQHSRSSLSSGVVDAVGERSLTNETVPHVLAYDFMTFSLADLEWLPSVTPALNLMFNTLEPDEFEDESAGIAGSLV